MKGSDLMVGNKNNAR